MAVNTINPTAFAQQWADKVAERMRQAGVNETDIEETATILRSFVKTGVEILIKDPTVKLPTLEQDLDRYKLSDGQDLSQLLQQREPFELTVVHINQVTDLFVRTVNHMAKTLRAHNFPWEARKDILEKASWETFNLSKVLVTLVSMPNSRFRKLENPQVFQYEMLQRGTDEILAKYLKRTDAG